MSASAAMSGSLAQVNSYAITATSLVATRAPRGQLDRNANLFASVIASIRPEPHWTTAVQQVLTNIGNVAISEAAKRSQIWQEVSRYTGNIITEQYRAQQAVQDRLAKSFSESVRDIDTYIDPSTGGRIQLSGGGSRAWGNGRGEYIVSNDPTFTPSNIDGNWTLLERAGN